MKEFVQNRIYILKLNKNEVMKKELNKYLVSQMSEKAILNIEGGRDVYTSGTYTQGPRKGLPYQDLWEDDNDNGIFDTGDCYSYWPWVA